MNRYIPDQNCSVKGPNLILHYLLSAFYGQTSFGNKKSKKILLIYIVCPLEGSSAIIKSGVLFIYKSKVLFIYTVCPLEGGSVASKLFK